MPNQNQNLSKTKETEITTARASKTVCDPRAILAKSVAEKSNKTRPITSIALLMTKTKAQWIIWATSNLPPVRSRPTDKWTLDRTRTTPRLIIRTPPIPDRPATSQSIGKSPVSIIIQVIIRITKGGQIMTRRLRILSRTPFNVSIVNSKTMGLVINILNIRSLLKLKGVLIW